MKFTRRGMLIGILAAVAAGGLGGWVRRMASGYTGPVSDHFDGSEFVGKYAAPKKTLLDILRWRMTADRAEWPDHVDNPPSEKPPARVDRGYRVTFVGHASMLLQAGGLNILIDPVWSERVSPFSFIGPKRVRPPGIAFNDLPKIDTVLVTHGHYDHLDVATLARLAKRDNPRFIAPLGQDNAMRGYAEAETFDWHQRVSLSDEVAVTLIPAQHWSSRWLFDRNKALWAGFVIETPAGKILHMTDTGYGDGSQFKDPRDRYGPFKLAILPIGAYEPRWFMIEQHINPAEAVQGFIDCGAERALANHFGTFQLTDEAIDAPVIGLKEALVAANIPAERFLALEPGQAITL